MGSVDEGRPLRRAAERFQVSLTTAQRCADRYREFGEAGMATPEFTRVHNDFLRALVLVPPLLQRHFVAALTPGSTKG